MAKIVIITDTHHGIKSDNIDIHNAQKKFYDEILFPYLKNNNIQYLFHLGDLVDKRKYITGLTLKKVKEDFFSPIENMNIQTHILVGNHDCYYKNTLTPNYVTELSEKKYKNIIFYNQPKNIMIDNLSILMLPWICMDNQDLSIKMINENKSRILMGHLELSGFPMYKGHSSKHGMDSSIFSKYHKVLSGHYHTRSINNNIYYLGTALDYTWSDYNDQKGFHVLDSDTLELEFIKTPFELHVEIEYDDNSNQDELLEKIKNKFIKINIFSPIDQNKFENFKNKAEIITNNLVVNDYSNMKVIPNNSDRKVENVIDIAKRNFENKPHLIPIFENIYIEAENLK